MRKWPIVCALVFLVLRCGGGDEGEPGEPPILDPEPAGAPQALVEPLGDVTVCLGANEPEAPDGTFVELLGYARYLANPHACPDNPARSAECGGFEVPPGRENSPPAHVVAFDASGAEIGDAYANNTNGRISIEVPVTEEGFTGHVEATYDEAEMAEYHIYSSLAYTSERYNGWAWMASRTDLEALAADAGVTLDAGAAVISGSVHDCNVLGAENAVVRVAGSTDGVLYADGFDLSPGFTYTDASGRFAVPNVAPGAVTVEAFGRVEADGPLVLLSRADVQAVAGAIVAVDLQPRAGVDR